MHVVDKKYLHSGVKTVVVTLKYVDHFLIDTMTLLHFLGKRTTLLRCTFFMLGYLLLQVAFI